MTSRLLLPTACVLTLAIIVSSIPATAQSIAGTWRTKSGEFARIGKCGAAWCITMSTGKHKGRRIGRFTKAGTGYAGTITDPRNNKTYNGKATVNGRSLSLSGCVFGGIFCRAQTWTKH